MKDSENDIQNTNIIAYKQKHRSKILAKYKSAYLEINDSSKTNTRYKNGCL